MNSSAEIDQLATALSQAQAEIQNVEAASKSYVGIYADLAAVLAMIRPHFSKHGLSLIQMPGNGEHGGISVTTRLMHQSGQWIEEQLEMPVEGGKNITGAQACGIIITYCRRYMATAFAGIAQEDPDASKDGDMETKNIPKRSTGRKPQSVAQTVMDESIPDADLGAAADYLTGIHDAVREDDRAGAIQLFTEMDNDMKVVVWNKMSGEAKRQMKIWERGDERSTTTG